MIEKIKTTTAFYFTVNPILFYDIWIASKVNRLNSLTQKYLNPFCLQKRLENTYFLKEYLICQEKTAPRSIYFLGNFDWGVGMSLLISTGKLFFKEVYIYSDTGTIFKRKGPSCKKKELHVNLTSNTFHRKDKNFDYNFTCVDLP